jgi:hypothetical protein
VDRNTFGYSTLQDPMSAFYETLCTGLDWIDDINMEGPLYNNQNNTGLSWKSSRTRRKRKKVLSYNLSLQ